MLLKSELTKKLANYKAQVLRNEIEKAQNAEAEAQNAAVEENSSQVEARLQTTRNTRSYLEDQLRQAQTITRQSATPKTPSEHRLNYITTNRFYVEMESSITASFSECSGLGVNIKKETYLEGGVNDHQRVILGHAEFKDVTLKRGMTDSFTFRGWVTETLSSTRKTRRNVNILLFNQAGETMQCWTLIGAIPISWKAPSLQADSNSVGIEELTLAYEGLKVVTNAGGGGATIALGRDSLGFFPNN